MSVYKIKVDFTKSGYSDSGLLQKASMIVMSLTGNKYFQELAPEIEKIVQKKEAFTRLLALAEDRGRIIIEQKRAARKELETVLRFSAFKVLDISGGDELILLSSGYDLCKKPTPVGQLEVPQGITYKVGKIRGSIIISCNVIKNAYVYCVEYTEVPFTSKSLWKMITSTKHVITIEGLIQGQHYAFRIAGIGTCPNQVWSNEIIFFAI